MFGELESSSQHQVISENGEREEVGVATGAEQQADRFGATRSLLRGKVSATTLQVRFKMWHRDYDNRQ